MPKTKVKAHSRKGTKGVKAHTRKKTKIKSIPHNNSENKSTQVKKALRLIQKREKLLKEGFATYSDEIGKIDDQIFKTMEGYDKKIEYWKSKQNDLKDHIKESNIVISKYEEIIKVNPQSEFIKSRYEPNLKDNIKFRKQQIYNLKTIEKRISNYEKTWDMLHKYME